MSTNEQRAQFQSALAPLMEQFVREKQACGYRYRSSAQLLACFDRFLSDEASPPGELPRSVSWKWLAKQPHESALTHRHRISIVRQFAMFMCRQGYPADVPDGSLAAKNDAKFSPRILTRAEVQKLLQAGDDHRFVSRRVRPMHHPANKALFGAWYAPYLVWEPPGLLTKR